MFRINYIIKPKQLGEGVNKNSNTMLSINCSKNSNKYVEGLWMFVYVPLATLWSWLQEGEKNLRYRKLKNKKIKEGVGEL